MECFKPRLSLSKEIIDNNAASTCWQHAWGGVYYKANTEHQENGRNWVHNISKHQLTETECSVLSRGLNHAKNHPVWRFHRTNRDGTWKHTGLWTESSTTQWNIRQKAAKLPPSNLKKRSRSLKFFSKKNPVTSILLADKGRTTVIMDTETCSRQMKTITHTKYSKKIQQRTRQTNSRRCWNHYWWQ